jgi:hypothetical protein
VESIPSSLVQIYAFLLSSQRSASLVASIIVSIATVAFGSTTMCFDFDLDPERRIHTPDFYGYVPTKSGQRSLVFYSMLLFSACHILLRFLGIGMIAVVFSPMITAAILGGDMAFFMIFKLARDDMRYWVRLDGALSWISSVVVRFVVKLMVDFTVMVQLRRKCR